VTGEGDVMNDDIKEAEFASVSNRDETQGTLEPHVGSESAQMAALRDRWMRSEAEIANVRMRAKRDIEAARDFAVQKFATDVVEVADNLRRGVASIPPVSATEPQILTRLREGFGGIERSFIDLLKRNGVEKDDPTGSAFNPDRHQAMAEHETGDHHPGTVLHASSAAWTLNDRLLRPAMVVVAKAPHTQTAAGATPR
jgi:molecular chaperone GrpE